MLRSFATTALTCGVLFVEVSTSTVFYISEEDKALATKLQNSADSTCPDGAWDTAFWGEVDRQAIQADFQKFKGESNTVQQLVMARYDQDVTNILFRFGKGHALPFALAAVLSLCWVGCCWQYCCQCCRCRSRKRNIPLWIKALSLLTLAALFTGILLGGVLIAMEGASFVSAGASNFLCTFKRTVSVILNGQSAGPAFPGLLAIMEDLVAIDTSLDNGSGFRTSIDEALVLTHEMYLAGIISEETLGILKSFHGHLVADPSTCTACQAMDVLLPPVLTLIKESQGVRLGAANKDFSHISDEEKNSLKSSLRDVYGGLITFKERGVALARNLSEEDSFVTLQSYVRDGSHLIAATVLVTTTFAALLVLCGCMAATRLAVQEVEREQLVAEIEETREAMHITGNADVLGGPGSSQIVEKSDYSDAVLCDICGRLMLWSSYAAGPYMHGWQCKNAAQCGSCTKKPGSYRWFCQHCLNDVCSDCIPLGDRPQPANPYSEKVFQWAARTWCWGFFFGIVTFFNYGLLALFATPLSQICVLMDGIDASLIDQLNLSASETDITQLKAIVDGCLASSSTPENPALLADIWKIPSSNGTTLRQRLVNELQSVTRNHYGALFDNYNETYEWLVTESAVDDLRVFIQQPEDELALGIANTQFQCDLFNKSGALCDPLNMERRSSGYSDCLNASDQMDRVRIPCNRDEFVPYLRDFDGRIQNVLLRLDQAVFMNKPQLELLLNDAYGRHISGPINRLSDKTTCAFMADYYQKAIDSLCFQGVYGLRLIARAYGCSACLSLILIVVMWGIWRLQKDNYDNYDGLTLEEEVAILKRDVEIW